MPRSYRIKLSGPKDQAAQLIERMKAYPKDLRTTLYEIIEIDDAIPTFILSDLLDRIDKLIATNGDKTNPLDVTLEVIRFNESRGAYDKID